MFDYKYFYRRFGIRRLDQLAKPQLFSTNALQLPKSSLLHYPSTSMLEYGPATDSPILRNVDKIIMVDHVVHLTSKKGQIRPTLQPVNKMIRDYHAKYRHTRPLRSLSSTDRDQLTLVVENYALLPHLFYYTTSFFANYYRWYNIQVTMWDKVKELVKQTQREQFIVMDLPQQLPPLSTLMIGEMKADKQRMLLEKLPEEEALFILEFWTWLGNHRENSILATLTEEELQKVNVIWQESGRWIMINMGLIDSWRKVEIADGKEGSGIEHRQEDIERLMVEFNEGRLDLSLEAMKGDLIPNLLQRRFMRTLTTLFEARTVAVGDDAIAANDTSANKAVTAQKKDVEGEASDVDLVPEEENDIDQPVLVTKTKQSHDTTTLHEALNEQEDDDIPQNSDEKERISEVNRIEDLTAEDDLRELTMMSERIAKKAETETYSVYRAPIEQPEDGVLIACDEVADLGLLSAAEYRARREMAVRYKSLPNPYTGKGTLAEGIKITPSETAIPHQHVIAGDVKGVLDKSMLSSSLQLFDPLYIRNVLPKDIMNSVVGIQGAGVAVQNYQVEHVEDVNNSVELHTVRLVPVTGQPSTIRFQIPKISESGTFKANGVTYHLRKQRGDMPIRKIAPDRVALTSYYSKLFVTRSERKINNYSQWLLNQLTTIGLDSADDRIEDVKFANVFDHEAKTARVFSIIASRMSGFRAKGDYRFDFNAMTQETVYGSDTVKIMREAGLTIAGRKGKALLVVDKNDMFYTAVNDNPNELEQIGTIETIIGLPLEKRPIETLEVGILGKPIPLGFVLAQEMGLGKLLKHVKIEPRRVPVGERLHLTDSEFAVRFSDEVLVFETGNKMAEFLFGGFNRYHKDIKRYSVYEFDKKDVYQTVLDRNGLTSRYYREIELMYRMYVDHITKELLIQMKEPTNLAGLFIRSAELLMTDDHPDQSDMDWTRDKGYERVAGIVYGEIVRALRAYKSRPATSAAMVEMNPKAVWMTILQDPAGKPIEEINPIHNLKEKEIVIFGGIGGRSSRSMTESSRTYHKSQMGVVSEATVDNSEVATITYLTADPNYNSVRGTTRRRTEKDGAARLVSTSMLSSPGADLDDPKRVNFIGIQHSQTIATVGYTPMPLRTGYERMLAHRVDDLFAVTATQVGHVISIDDRHINVQYEDGSNVAVELGRRFGEAAGNTIPHFVKSDLKVGDKVKKGGVIAYNSNYFGRDSIDPSQVLWKPGVVVKTVLWESPETFEDSSTISEKLSRLLATKETKVKTIRLRFEQEVRNLVRVGDKVDLESILCTIEDSSAGNSDLFDEESLQTLSVLTNLTPRAKMTGVIEKIEVLYNGHTDDMSSSLRSVALASDRARASLNQSMGKKKVTGKVDSEFRIDGSSLEMDSLAILVYITGDVAAGVGDKGVFANQMKTTFGRVMTGINRTKSGEDIDAIFGYRSINDRIVNSPILIGTANTLLKLIGKQAVKAYRSE